MDFYTCMDYIYSGGDELTFDSWSFLEKGINSVMLNLEAGVDMRTVCSYCWI